LFFSEIIQRGAQFFTGRSQGLAEVSGDMVFKYTPFFFTSRFRILKKPLSLQTNFKKKYVYAAIFGFEKRYSV
jgi:hypothetical protein